MLWRIQDTNLEVELSPGIVLDNANKPLQKLLTASRQRTKDRYYGFQGNQTQLMPPDLTEMSRPKSDLFKPRSDLVKNLFQTPTPAGYQTLLDVPDHIYLLCASLSVEVLLQQ